MSLKFYPGGEFIKSISDINVANKKVFLRLDLNVPIKDNKIIDDNRILEALPTIKYLIENNAKIICASHMGRPNGKKVKSLSLEPVAARLSELLEQEVSFTDESTGNVVENEANFRLKPGNILLLENLRFNPGEAENSPTLAAKFKKFTDIYVNDAFGTSHREHCSNGSLTKLFSIKAAGLLMEKEINSLANITYTPPRPLVAIIGGAKISDKINVIENLMIKASKILIGGAMAHTFSASKGYSIGESLVEENKIPLAKKLLERAKDNQCEIITPVDYIYNSGLNATSPPSTTLDSHIPKGQSAFDIGPKAQLLFAQEISSAKAIFWNGPMGVFENSLYQKGTKAIAESIANSNAEIKICGGGDSVACINKLNLKERFTHVSTGGGASLQLIEGKKLPAVENLKIYK